MLGEMRFLIKTYRGLLGWCLSGRGGGVGAGGCVVCGVFVGRVVLYLVFLVVCVGGEDVSCVLVGFGLVVIL